MWGHILKLGKMQYVYINQMFSLFRIPEVYCGYYNMEL